MNQVVVIDAGYNKRDLVNLIRELREHGWIVGFDADDIFNEHTGAMIYLYENGKVTWTEALFYNGKTIPIYDYQKGMITEEFLKSIFNRSEKR